MTLGRRAVMLHDELSGALDQPFHWLATQDRVEAQAAVGRGGLDTKRADLLRRPHLPIFAAGRPELPLQLPAIERTLR